MKCPSCHRAVHALHEVMEIIGQAIIVIPKRCTDCVAIAQKKLGNFAYAEMS